ncbi:MAG: hypothetical protein LBT04_02990 [Prevotellaceae bacterium]|jgi:hypothetical protein|nr:hypothetical protein [Prevotellaceae bacterium]
MKKIVLVFLVMIALFSCNKDRNESSITLTKCQKENVGYLKVNNTTSDSYDLFINDVYKQQIPAHHFVQGTLSAGHVYNVQVRQVSGYFVSPTIKNFSVTINMCDEKTVSF